MLHILPQPAIVVLDDEPTIGFILERVLRDLAPEYEIILLTDAEAVLLPLSAGLVRLLIADDGLSQMHNSHLVQLVKQVTPATRILLLTGYPHPDTLRRAYASGVDAVLAKPFQLGQLDALIQQLLR
jgi:DNA-binding NarL/FixJ family response regulator